MKTQPGRRLCIGDRERGRRPDRALGWTLGDVLPVHHSLGNFAEVRTLAKGIILKNVLSGVPIVAQWIKNWYP